MTYTYEMIKGLKANLKFKNSDIYPKLLDVLDFPLIQWWMSEATLHNGFQWFCFQYGQFHISVLPIMNYESVGNGLISLPCCFGIFIKQIFFKKFLGPLQPSVVMVLHSTSDLDPLVCLTFFLTLYLLLLAYHCGLTGLCGPESHMVSSQCPNG